MKLETRRYAHRRLWSLVFVCAPSTFVASIKNRQKCRIIIKLWDKNRMELYISLIYSRKLSIKMPQVNASWFNKSDYSRCLWEHFNPQISQIHVTQMDNNVIGSEWICFALAIMGLVLYEQFNSVDQSHIGTFHWHFDVKNILTTHSMIKRLMCGNTAIWRSNKLFLLHFMAITKLL